MRQVAHIARREVLELIRQPWMIGFISVLYVFIGLYLGVAAGLMQLVALDPVAEEQFMQNMGALGFDGLAPSEIIGWIVSLGNFLAFTQYLGISSVLAGHTVLHERQSHTLPFLLLSPVSRGELLLGKVLGAIVLPTGLYLMVAVGAMGFIGLLPLSADHAAVLPPSPAWLVAVLVGGPIWALGVGIICATLSAMARDVRTAQQGVWFVMFPATLSAGYLLAGRMADGPVVQLVVAALALVLAGAALLVGSQVISRDLSR